MRRRQRRRRLWRKSDEEKLFLRILCFHVTHYFAPFAAVAAAEATLATAAIVLEWAAATLAARAALSVKDTGLLRVLEEAAVVVAEDPR